MTSHHHRPPGRQPDPTAALWVDIIQEVRPLHDEMQKATAALIEANRALHEDLPGELATAFRAAADYLNCEMGEFRTGFAQLAEIGRLAREGNEARRARAAGRENLAALLGLVVGVAVGALAAWVAIRW